MADIHQERARKRVIVCYLEDFRRLMPLLHYVELASAVSHIISDVDGDFSGLQLLKTVALTAAPLIDVLREDRKQILKS